MKIAVVGCGAMGSVYAAKLANQNSVLAIARWKEHVDQMAQHGLRLEGPLTDETVQLRASTLVPAEPMDLVILAVKAAQAGQAARDAVPLLGTQTVVLTIQNGLGAADVVADVVGAERLAVGIASGFGASIKAPGHIHHNAMRAVRLGAYDSLALERVEAVAAVWREAGFDARAVSDIAAMQWEKLICNVAYSAPCALTGFTIGQAMDDPHIGPITRAAAIEAWEVARAAGIRVSVDDPVEHVRAFGASMPAAKPSALLDHEARRVSEIEVINGAIPREAKKVGLKAPVNETLVALVKVRERQWN
jgi:2-dehydropantoate 2-reductase